MAGANAVGPANLRIIAEMVLERMDVDELVVEGAVRTIGPVGTVDRVSSGSRADLVLIPDKQPVATVIAALALARRGMPLLGAKRALEELLASGRAFVAVPTVEDADMLMSELVAAKVLAKEASVDEAIRERLSLSQGQIALLHPPCCL